MKKINHQIFILLFAIFIILFLASAVYFGYNAKNFHRKGNTMVTPEQVKGSQRALIGLIITALSAIGFLLTLVVFFHSKH
jgi:ABC-type multidrug transport system permease subunit